MPSAEAGVPPQSKACLNSVQLVFTRSLFYTLDICVCVRHCLPLRLSWHSAVTVLFGLLTLLINVYGL